jgi:hypothetical protein
MKPLPLLKAGVRSIFPSCRDVSRLQSEQLDHPLSLTNRFGVQLHLFLCRWCRRYGKQLRFLRQALHDHPEQLTAAEAPGLSPDARDRLKRAVRESSP